MELQTAAGAANLISATGLKPGESLLLLAESPEHRLYDGAAAIAISVAASQVTSRVHVMGVGVLDSIESLNATTSSLLSLSDRVVFQARLGDSIRFDALRSNMTMSYAYNATILGSTYCTTDHNLMKELSSALLAELQSASTWRLTTTDGTDLEGRVRVLQDEDAGYLERFPVSTIPALSCNDASGTLQVAPWITSTSHRFYENHSLTLEAPVAVSVEQGRIVRFEGRRHDIEKLQHHYNYVADLFSIDPYIVDSWHAGIHPQCRYDQHPAVDVELWGRSVFASPAYAHFHTCGSYTPGEVCLSIVRPTIALDGVTLWKDGRLVFYETEPANQIIRDFGLEPGGFVETLPIGIGH